MNPAWIALAIQAAMAGKELLSGGDDYGQVPTMTGQQRGFQKDIIKSLREQMAPGGGYNQGMGILQQYLDPNSSIYKNFEQPYINQFEQETVPGIAERFAGAGALSSSGFGQSLSSAAGNLQTNLAQMKSGMQRNAINDIFGQFNAMMNPAFQSQFAYKEKGGSPWTSALINFDPSKYSGYGNQQQQPPQNPQGMTGAPGAGYGGYQNARYVPPNYPIA